MATKRIEVEEVEVDPMTVLSDDQLRKYKEVFSTFDEADEGSIVRADLGAAMKVLGFSPTEDDLKSLSDKYAPEGKFDFQAFCKALHKQANNPYSKEAMIRAFRVFDPRGLGVVTQAEFRYIFSQAGGEEASLDAVTVDELVDYADEAQAGQVNYETFVAKLFDELEEHKKKKAAEISAKK